MDFDAVIIGAGAVGCACARELSKYDLKTAVLEKASDAACGTSGAEFGGCPMPASTTGPEA
jgi:glycerol-3-phosphate dehydrogenase